MEDYRDNLEIDLKDLFIQIISKIKLIAICMVLGAIIGGAYIFLQPQQSNTEEEDETAETSTTETLTTEETIEALTDKEKNEVEMTVNSYLSYKELYDNILDYKENSILMNMDSNAVYTSYSLYYIDGYKESEMYVTSSTVVDHNYQYG